MKRRIIYEALWLLALLDEARPQPQRELKGEVVTKHSNVHIDYHAGVEVRLKGHGVERKTNDNGEFRLPLPDTLASAIAEVIIVVNKPGYTIYRPDEGQLDFPQDLTRFVTIEILPLRHPLFKTPEEIGKWFDKIPEKAKDQVKKEGEPEKLDLSRYIKEWAWQYGFTPEEAQKEIDAWVKEALKSRDPSERANAEFGNSNFVIADSLYGEAAALWKEHRERLRKKHAAEEKEVTKKIIDDLHDQGHSCFQDYRFDDALRAYEKALSEADSTQFPKLWAVLQNDIGLANWHLGIRVEGEKAINHLNFAVAAYRKALQVRTREKWPRAWAMTQNYLALVLLTQGSRTLSARGAELVEQAISASRGALEIFTRENEPRQWAAAQHTLGLALSVKSIHTAGTDRTTLLVQAISASRGALEIFTRENEPQQWAAVQSTLGIVLSLQYNYVTGAKGKMLLAQAVFASRAALEVLAREKEPQQWALAQFALGFALLQQCSYTVGVEGKELSEQAVSASRAALEVFTRENEPQHWVTAQSILGSTLTEQGIRSDSTEGLTLLAQAVSTFHTALEVDTREVMPLLWADIQVNLGIAQYEQGSRIRGEKGVKFLAQAVEACHNALQIYTRKLLPQEWANIQRILGDALSKQGIRIGGQEGAKMLVEAYKLASEVKNFEYLPVDWVQIHNELAQNAYKNAIRLYHEVLFDFPKAFELNQQWLQQHPNDLLEQIKFVEKHFTTGRFAECEEQIKRFINKKDYSPEVYIVMGVISIGNNLALKRSGQVLDRIDLLLGIISKQPKPKSYTVKWPWPFEGTKHFISQNETLAPYRAWLLQLFQALEIKAGREAILAALREVREKFKAVAGK